jgi:GGDEF domain-containing protein
MTARWFHVGSSPQVAAAFARLLGGPPAGARAAPPGKGDTVVVEAFADLSRAPDVAGHNAFSACREWKQRGATVHVAVRTDDPTGAQLARFVLADGVVRVAADGAVLGMEGLAPHDRARSRATIDALLARYGAAMRADGDSPVLQRMREWERDDSLLQRLQDAETGLFDGAYAALKLDEEWKRSQRFHLPLALVLLDIGAAAAAMPAGPDRRALLAEVAAVFLNECRDIDVLGRFTATTFLMLLPGTPPAGAEALVRRLLEALAERTFAVALAPVAGVAAVPMPGISDRKDFLAVAEACLDRARSQKGLGGLVVAWE